MTKYVLSTTPEVKGETYNYYIESKNGCDRHTTILAGATIFTEEEAEQGVETYCHDWKFVTLNAAKRRKR